MSAGGLTAAEEAGAASARLFGMGIAGAEQAAVDGAAGGGPAAAGGRDELLDKV